MVSSSMATIIRLCILPNTKSINLNPISILTPLGRHRHQTRKTDFENTRVHSDRRPAFWPELSAVLYPARAIRSVRPKDAGKDPYSAASCQGEILTECELWSCSCNMQVNWTFAYREPQSGNSSWPRKPNNKMGILSMGLGEAMSSLKTKQNRLSRGLSHSSMSSDEQCKCSSMVGAE
jgi:hypothetical protein